MLSTDELLLEIEKDSKIDRSDIMVEVYRSTELLGKWMRYHQQYKSAAIRGESILNGKIRDALMYYDGKGDSEAYKARPFNLTLNNQRQKDLFLDADEECCYYREQVDLTNENIKLCEDMIESLRFRPKHLELVHAIRVFEQGG